MIRQTLKGLVLVALTCVAAMNPSLRAEEAFPTAKDLADFAAKNAFNTCGLCASPIARTAKAPAQAAPRLLTLSEVEPNDDPFTAPAIPLGTGPGLDQDIIIQGEITLPDDVDYFRVNVLKGDVIGIAVSRQLGLDTKLGITDANGGNFVVNGDFPPPFFLYPGRSPFPYPVNTTDSAVSFVFPQDGDYRIRVTSEDLVSSGFYTLNIRKRRPFLELSDFDAVQKIFLDFDGQIFDPESIFGQGLPSANASPLSTFLDDWNLLPTDEGTLIDLIIADVTENFGDLRQARLNGDRPTDGIPGHYDVIFLNSRDDFPDPFGQRDTSRVIVGGTIAETGLNTIGLAQSIDPGNFDTNETAIVLLDLLSAPAGDPNSVNTVPLGPGVPKTLAVSRAVGNIISHEIGHYTGCWHQNNANNVRSLMDAGGVPIRVIMGVGNDGDFGTADDIDLDFFPDGYHPPEQVGIDGSIEFADVRIAFGLATGSLGGLGGPRALPDLTVESINFPFAAPVAGVPFEVRAAVCNRGFAVSPTEFFTSIFLQPKDATVGSLFSVAIKLTAALQINECQEVTFLITVPAPGIYGITVLADSQGNILESNESNNLFTRTLSLGSPGSDLVIANVTKTEPTPGVSATFTVTVENRGLTPVGGFSVGYYANRVSAPSVGDTADSTQAVAFLSAFGKQTLTFNLPAGDPATPRAGTSWFLADSTNTIAETNESNNTGSATWGVRNGAVVVTSPIVPSTTQASIGETVTFTITVTDPDGDPLIYEWDFGDGTKIINGPTVTHVYSTDGVFVVTVTIHDGPFNSVTQTFPIEVIKETLIDLGTVSLSAQKGRVKLKVPLPSAFGLRDRVKSKIIAGSPGPKVKYSNLKLNGKVTAKGEQRFTIEFLASKKLLLQRFRYKYTVID